MFESIISKITNTVRNVARAVGSATRNAPLLTAAAAILALFLIW
jgi:hypothetical protein